MSGTVLFRNPPLAVAATLLLILSLLLPGFAPPAQAGLCPALKIKPKVRLEAELGEPRILRSLDPRDMKKLVQKYERNLHRTRGRPLGLTVAPFTGNIATSFRYSRVQGGGHCVWLVAATVTIGFKDLTVYLNRDYAPGSCQYETVLTHEMEHVNLSRDTVRKYLPKLRAKLLMVVRGKPYIRVLGGRRQARDAYILLLQQQLRGTLNEMEAERRRKNKKIDTRASYQELSTKCAEW